LLTSGSFRAEVMALPIRPSLQKSLTSSAIAAPRSARR